MRTMVGKIMTNYGIEIGLEQEEAVAVCRGFFQPVHETSLQQLELTMDSFGREPGGKYEIMVPISTSFDVGTRVVVEEQWYVVRATETIYGGSVPLYRWGLLVKEGVEDGDIS